MQLNKWICAVALAGLAGMPAAAAEPGEFADLAGNAYRVHADVAYAVASNVELKLDVYQPRGARPHRFCCCLSWRRAGRW